MSRRITWGTSLILYSGYLVLTLTSYFQQFPIPEFLFKLLSLFIFLFFIWLVFGVGELILSKYFQTLSLQRVSALVFSFGLGLGLISVVVLLLGWVFPWNLKWKLLILTLILSGVALVRKPQQLKFFTSYGKKFPLPSSFFELSCCLMGSMGMCVVLFSCFSPITYYDSLVYHLGLPGFYLHQGFIGPVPFNLYSFFPQNMEMLHLYLMVLCGSIPADYVINLLGWFVSLCISLFLFDWLYQVKDTTAAWLSWFLWWTMPSVMLLSIGAYVDIPLAFFTLLSLFAFLQSINNKEEVGWAILAGLFSSLACSTKYTGIITPVLLVGLYGLDAIHRKKNRWRAIGLFVASAAFPFGVWLIKNWVTIKNPVFPFLYNFLGGDVGWTKETASGYFQMLTEYGTKSNLFFDLLLAPWKIVTSSLQFGGGMDVLGDFGWGSVLYSLFFVGLVGAADATWLVMLGYSAGHFLFWIMTKPVLRFLISLLPLLILISSLCMNELVRHRSRILKGVLIFLIGPWFVSNIFIYINIASELRLFSVAFGNDSYWTFLTKRLNYIRAYDLINTQLPADQSVVLIGDQRIYHLKRTVLSSNLFGPSLVSEWCNEGEEKLKVGITSHKVGMVLINKREIDRLGGYPKFGFTLEGENHLKEFLRRSGTVLFDASGVVLHRVS